MAANFSSSSSLAIILLLFHCFLHAATDLSLPISNRTVDFPVELIHRYSPESPIHNPASTSFSHHAAINSTVDFSVDSNSLILNMSALITRHRHDYIMKFYLGTPPKPFLALIDTGSHLSWVLCSKCNPCYSHKGHIFIPQDSPSYEIHPCLSDACDFLDHSPCVRDSPCEYRITNRDGTYARGLVSTEILWFISLDSKKKVRVSRILFGCTHSTRGKFNSGTVGIVGFSGHNLSLISQLGPAIGNMFSYCLPFRKKSARMFFGTAAAVSGPGAVSIPFFLSIQDSFYTIILENITVVIESTGKTFTVNLEQTTTQRSNHMIMDTGTQATYIDPRSMDELSELLEEHIPNERVGVPEEVANSTDLCFASENQITEMPKIVFEFQGGAEVHLLESFMLVNKKTMCLAMASNAHSGGESIFGYHAQKGHRIGYNLNELRITFLTDIC